MSFINKKNNENINQTTNQNVNTEESKPNVENKEVQQENKSSDDELKKLKDTIIELDNKVKYTQAELINYRKRKDEEVSNLLKFANKDLILELIPDLDNFERAIKLDDTNLNDELSKFLAGFKMIYSHLSETLKKYGVEEIETVGKVFDPNVHEALMTKTDPNKPNEEVLECLLKGYTLKGKVIRAAKVVVNKID